MTDICKQFNGQELQLYHDELVTAKNGNTYWRRIDCGKAIYNYIEGDKLNRKRNIIRQTTPKFVEIYIVTEKTTNVTNTLTNNLNNEDNTEISVQIAEMLCSVINELVKNKDVVIINTEIVNKRFKINYTLHGKNMSVVQPLK